MEAKQCYLMICWNNYSHFIYISVCKTCWVDFGLLLWTSIFRW